jgi:hypothetical protein
MMAFQSAEYDVYFLLGDPNAEPLWNWPVWHRLLPSLDPIIHRARGMPAVRSTQFPPNRAGTVKFGRIGWKEADHQKWTHGPTTNPIDSKSWGFLSAQVWAPAWTQCERDKLAPDVFLSITNESLGAGCRKELSFNPVVILAVVSQLAQREVLQLAKLLSSRSSLTESKLSGCRRRPWAHSLGAAGSRNSIQDLGIAGLFKPGRRHIGKVDSELLVDQWEPINAAATPDL